VSRQFYIRCDASPTVGVGHFMRTCCLARALRHKHSVCFVMAATTPLVESVLREERFPLLRLDAGISMAEELPLIASKVGAQQDSSVIVDHYGATPTYLYQIRETTPSLGIVDDLADRDLTAADWVLNQNLGAEQLTYKTRPDCRRFLGTRYCLLRPQFAQARKKLKRRFSATDNRVLITLGGGAMLPVVAQILGALETVTRRLELRVIMAGNAACAGGAPSGMGSARHTLDMLHNVTNMAEHMAWADMSINAGGSTTWELCTLGVPMIVVPLSHDQVPTAALLEQAGCAVRVPPESIVDQLAPFVTQCLQTVERRSLMSVKGQRLVDGLGARRAALALEETVCSR
jgi:UDP-2,4-diacetamido-2,4,6-trideoxy-beta-L-altropyranose hydrolase